MDSSDVVDVWLAEARQAFPDLDVPEDVYRAAALARAGTAPLHAADLYLACGCALRLAPALQRFEDEHVARIGAWLKTDAAVADEVRQQVRIRVLVGADGARPRIADYSARGPLGAWVRVIALREHASLRRAAVVSEDELGELAATDELGPELTAMRGRYQPLISDALRAALADLPPRDRTLVRLAYVDALSLDAIGKMYAVHRSTVCRWLASARALVLAAASASLRAALRANEEDVDSLLGLVRSSLDLGLSSLLGRS